MIRPAIIFSQNQIDAAEPKLTGSGIGKSRGAISIDASRLRAAALAAAPAAQYNHIQFTQYEGGPPMFPKIRFSAEAIIHRVIGSAIAVLASAALALAADKLPEPELSDSGLHVQPWFIDSFLDLAEDLAEAGAEGKKLIIFIEQAGCPYCRELHEVNLRDPEIVAYLNEHFVSVQLDLRGSREVTDFDGEAMEERALTRKWGMIYTPTLVFFSPDKAGDGTKIGRDLAVSVMPGYFKPFHFRTMLEYVADGHYETGKQFQDFINERAAALRARGEKVDIWEAPLLRLPPALLSGHGALSGSNRSPNFPGAIVGHGSTIDLNAVHMLEMNNVQYRISRI